MDDVLQWDQLSLVQQLNVQCDMLAKAAVSRAVGCLAEGNTPHQTVPPREYVAVFVQGNKVMSDPANDLRFCIGQASGSVRAGVLGRASGLLSEEIGFFQTLADETAL